MDLYIAIMSEWGDCYFTFENNDYDTLVWNDANPKPKPTLEELQEAWSRLNEVNK
jgi:hypothetical protein